MQRVKTPDAHPHINLPIMSVGMARIKVIRVPTIITAFMTRIALLRPKAKTLPPKTLPIASPA